jgi:hypothetical protein
MSEAFPWHLEGDYFEACNCETACPCIWLKAPSEGNCKLLVAWHVERGRCDSVMLDGLNVALACYAPGTMIEGGWKVALYVDERADEAQTAALVRIFAGQAGGHPAVLASLVSEVLGVKKVPMAHEALGKERRLNLADVGEMHIRTIEGVTGAEATISNPPLCVVPSHPSVVASSETYRYRDYGFEWEFSGRNGFFSPFEYHP